MVRFPIGIGAGRRVHYGMDHELSDIADLTDTDHEPGPARAPDPRYARMVATKKGKKVAAQERLIAALLAADSISEAAKLASVNHTTANKWLADADFSLRYAAARRALIDHAIGRLCARMQCAIDGLVDEANNLTNPAVRVRACEAILTQTRQALAESILLTQLDDLRNENRRLKKATTIDGTCTYDDSSLPGPTPSEPALDGEYSI